MGINKDKIDAALLLAFEAGRWMGQVDLEEHIDNEQYAASCIESVYSGKMSMPLGRPSTARTVEYNLRSYEWRNGVKKSASEYLDMASTIAIDQDD